MPRFGKDELFHLHRHRRRSEFRQHGVRDVSGEFFNEFPFAVLAKFQQPLRDGKIINGVADGIRFGGGGN